MKRSKERSPAKGSIGLLLLLLITLSLSGCGLRKKNVISRFGLSYIQLGDDLPAPGLTKFKKYAAHDTIMETDEYTWRATVLKYKKGKVYLEEDFWGSDMLNRIRITTPELHLPNGIGVGSSLMELTQSWDEWFILPFPEYKLFDFYSRLYPRVHFLIADPSVNMNNPDYENYKLSDFNLESTVKWIVIL